MTLADAANGRGGAWSSKGDDSVRARFPRSSHAGKRKLEAPPTPATQVDLAFHTTHRWPSDSAATRSALPFWGITTPVGIRATTGFTSVQWVIRLRTW